MPETPAYPFRPLDRDYLVAIGKELYGKEDRWYAMLARDLTRVRGTGTAISPAAVHQWMHAENRRPPAWATPLVYKLLAERRAELVIRAAWVGSWIKELGGILGKGEPRRRPRQDAEGHASSA